MNIKSTDGMDENNYTDNSSLGYASSSNLAVNTIEN